MAKKKDNINREPLSHYEHTAMWMAYRYAIGRHTAAANGFAHDLIKAVYYRLTEAQKKQAVLDIRRMLNMCLNNDFSFVISESIAPDKYNPFKALYDFFNSENMEEVDIIEYLENNRVIADKVDGNGVFTYQAEEPIFEQKKCWHNLGDLIEWNEVADVLDQNNHYIATIEREGVVSEDVEVFNTYLATTNGKLISTYIVVEDYIKDPMVYTYYVDEEIKDIKPLR